MEQSINTIRSIKSLSYYQPVKQLEERLRKSSDSDLFFNPNYFDKYFISSRVKSFLSIAETFAKKKSTKSNYQSLKSRAYL